MSEFQYRLLTIKDLPEIEALQQLVVAELADSSILQPLSREELLNILGENGIMLGAFDDANLIACRALLKPFEDEDEHLGDDAGVKDLTRVLYQEVSFVHPKYRGYSLQRKLGERIMQEVNVNDFDVVCATVKPYNIASLKDKFHQGLQVVALKLKYGGKLRYVFAKHFHEERAFSGAEVMIEMCETERQQQLLKDGYIGTQLVSKCDKWYVVYQK